MREAGIFFSLNRLIGEGERRSKGRIEDDGLGAVLYLQPATDTDFRGKGKFMSASKYILRKSSPPVGLSV